MDHPTSQLVTVYVITRTILKQGTVDKYLNTRVLVKEWDMLDIIKGITNDIDRLAYTPAVFRITD